MRLRRCEMEYFIILNYGNVKKKKKKKNLNVISYASHQRHIMTNQMPLIIGYIFIAKSRL